MQNSFADRFSLKSYLSADDIVPDLIASQRKFGKLNLSFEITADAEAVKFIAGQEFATIVNVETWQFADGTLLEAIMTQLPRLHTLNIRLFYQSKVFPIFGTLNYSIKELMLYSFSTGHSRLIEKCVNLKKLTITMKRNYFPLYISVLNALVDSQVEELILSSGVRLPATLIPSLKKLKVILDLEGSNCIEFLAANPQLVTFELRCYRAKPRGGYLNHYYNSLCWLEETNVTEFVIHGRNDALTELRVELCQRDFRNITRFDLLYCNKKILDFKVWKDLSPEQNRALPRFCEPRLDHWY